MLGVDKVKENTLLWVITGATELPVQRAIMEKKLAAFSATLKHFAKFNGLNVDWQHFNYVDKTQDPLKSYGCNNVNFIRRVAAKYDPSGMFQDKVPSDWKISKVDA